MKQKHTFFRRKSTKNRSCQPLNNNSFRIINHSTTTTTSRFPPKFAFLSRFQENLSGRHVAAWRTRGGSRQAAARAPSGRPCAWSLPRPSTTPPFPPKFKEELVGRHVQHDAQRGPKTARTTMATHFEHEGGQEAGALQP